MRTQINGYAAKTAALAVAVVAGSAAAGIGDQFSVTIGIGGVDWTTNFSGSYVDDSTYVARLDWSEVASEVGGLFDLGSGEQLFDFFEYRAEGSNLRAGGGAQTVNLNFNVTAGFSNTSFGFNASPVSFAPYPIATGEASASVSLTSFFTGGTGATFSPNGAGAYEANYNSGGSVFTNLFASPLSVATDSTTQTFNSGTVTGPLFGSVGDIGANWDFTLSAFDSAAGTSTFTVVPAPGALALVGLGGLAAARRRR